MEIEINTDSIIEDGLSRSKKPTLIIDGYVLKVHDKIIYTCTQCGKQVSQLFCFNKRFLSKQFICKTCSTKKTKFQKYGDETFTNKVKAKNTMMEKYGVPTGFQTENNRQAIKKSAKSQEVIKKRKQTKLKKYGDENYNNREKYKQTCLEKYGDENPFAYGSENFKKYMFNRYGGYTLQSKELLNKVKQTNIKKYGVEWGLQNDTIKNKSKQTKLKKYGDENYNNREKYKQTSLKRYGTQHPNQIQEIKEKIKNTQIKRYGSLGFNTNKQKQTQRRNFYNRLLNSDRLKNKVEPLFALDDYKSVKYKYWWRCTQCDNEFEDHICDGHIPRCPTCYPSLIGTSYYEEEIYKWLQSSGIENIERNTKKIISPYEIDLYLPDYKLAIEFNGLYWHSELQGKDKHYHSQKTLECSKQNIDLIHIFEDEWLNKQDIVQSIIKSKLNLNEKLYARKCTIKEVNNQPEFLFDNHLQGSVNSKINIGLYHNDELVSLLSLSKPRYNKQYDWEILRFVNKLGISVIGGFSKLINYFQNNYSGSIITYSDKRYFDGSIYKNNGFEQSPPTKPNYYYTDYIQRFNRIGFQKHKLEEQLGLYDSNLTEWENMQLNGWDRIWDCGNNVFILK